MRKFFSQKSKHKTTHQHPILPATTSTLTGSSSLVVSPLTSDKDDETQIATKKQNKTQTTSSHLQHSTTIQLETNPSDSVVNSTSSESRSSEITNSSVLKQDEMEEKSKKLFVVVSDADSTCNSSVLPAVSNENTDSHLLSVDECETSEPVPTLQQAQHHALSRKRSSTGSGQHIVRYREQNSKKFVEERLRRRSWMVSQGQLLSTSANCPNNMSTSINNSQTSEIYSHNQQNQHLSRLRRLRLGQSEPNLSSLQMNYFYQTSPSLKSSPRTSSAITNDNSNSNSTNLQLAPSQQQQQQQQQQHYYPFPLRRPSSRRSNLSGLNLINLKYALRKQLSPQQQTLCPTSSESQDSNKIPNSFNPSSTSAFKPIIAGLDDNSNRRWSLTSAPSSSGYGTTTPITCHSHESSQYSSFERLQHQQQQQQQQQQQSQQHLCTCKQQTNLPNSNEGSLSNVSPHEDFLYGSLQRLESRSISMSMLDANISSSPCKMLNMSDQEMDPMAYVYKERYPKAKVQMEERLQNFVDTYKAVDKYDYCSDGSARFIHNQIVELARNCVEKSHENLVTTSYFNEMTNSLERLLLDAKDKCPQAIENLQTVVRKLLLTIARSARLLECLEFDPEDFLRTLDEVECQAKINGNIKQDIPKYICSKLNLERNPLDVIDALQVNESNDIEHPDTIEHKSSVSESENESLTDSNYLTITPNTTFPPIEETLSTKTPCEDDFEIIKLISNGAYGAVHLVKHRQSHERYAMKKISKTHLILRNQVEQAFVERDIMTFTDNPFVVALICTFETKRHLCLVMEYVEGGDVATLLKNIGGPLNIDIARMYFAETTLAVEYLHSYGIIHRDLKPDNLLITAVGHIKLTDFGLSKIGLMSLTTNFYEKHIDKETKAFNDKQICGTPSYIAPEVILRQGYGKPVDWWSMGIILYEFLVGIPPFTGNTPDELFVNVINGQIYWPDMLDESTIDLSSSSSSTYDLSEQFFCPDAKSLIEQLLEHDPSKRLGTLGGAYEIRSHPFCACINWNTLLREKADFVPVLESPDDTSYFDTRQDRYQHSDDDILSSTTNKQTQITGPDNDSDVLFASFSSVSLKYVSELSGNHKQRHSIKAQQQDSTTTNTTTSEMSSTDVSRANSCSEGFHPDNVIRINSPSGFQPLIMTQSMPVETSQQVQPSCIPSNFGSDTFEPLLVSSDDNSSESSSIKKNSSIHASSDKLLLSNPCLSRKNSSSSSSVSSSLQIPTVTTMNADEKKTVPIATSTPSTTTKHKQRKTSLRLLEQQNANDSGDDNQQQQKSKTRHHQHHHHHHKKIRNPRTLSPLEPKQSFTFPIQATTMNISSNSKSQDLIQSIKLNTSLTSSQITPTVSISTENEFKKSASSNSLIPSLTTKTNLTTISNKPVKFNNQQLLLQQQINFPRSLSKSFSSSSSSSSPPPIWFNHPDDRSYRHTQRHNMAVSPLERDTTLKAQQQNSFSSSTISPIHSITNNLRPPIIIRRGPRSFGFTLRAVKVFHGNSDYYTTQHVVVAVEGPAAEAGLRVNDVITHVNERPVAGLLHPEVVKLILSGSPKLSIRAIPRSETQIRTGGRRRSPSKQKIRYQQQYDNKKIPTSTSIHQSYCQKHRMSATSISTNLTATNSNGNNLNKKHPQNNSLFRRLSERKVARDMEAAAAAAGVPLIIPTTLTTNMNNNNNNNTLTTTNTSILSSSLPLLSFNQLSHDHNNDRPLAKVYHQTRPNVLDSSEWPPLQAPLKPPTPTSNEPDSPQPTLLPSIIKQKSQISVSPLARCPPPSNNTTSTASNQPVHHSLCKTLSEPPILPRHTNHVQYPSRLIHNEHNQMQNYFYAPIISTHKKKVFHKIPVMISSSSDSSFVLGNNHNGNIRYVDTVYYDQTNSSSSTESSTSSTSTLRHVDSYSSAPVVVPTKFFYRRR